MGNMTNIISSHNKKARNSYSETNGKRCNCRIKSSCPLDNKCLANKNIYKAQVETTTASMSYLPKFILALVRQNLSPSTTTIQCHLETI